MRPSTLILAGLTVALSGCATASDKANDKKNEAQQQGLCRAEPVQYAIGQSYTVEIGAELQEKSGAQIMRVIRPGQGVTMDYRVERLNVSLSDQDLIDQINCG